MLPLHYRGFWQAASLLILLCTLGAALAPVFWLWDSKVEAVRWFNNADKWLHVLAFAALALWFSGLYEARSFWRVAIGLVAFGAAIEVLQRVVGYRSADIFDLLADIVGIVIGLGIGLLGAAGWCARFERHWLVKE